MADDTQSVRERVAEVCRVLGVMELTRDATGHASARLSGTERIFIRGRGPGELGVRFTSAAEILEVNLEGKVVGANHEGLEAPREVFIHTSIYKVRPDVFGIVHVHPISVVLLTICRRPLRPLYGAYDPPSAKLAIEGVPEYPRSFLCDTPERGADLAECLGTSSCCTMRGHGLTSCGPNVEEAALLAIHLNDLADINCRAALLGNAEEIPPEERRWITEGARFAASAQGGASPRGRAQSLWRYYRSLAETTRPD